MVSRLYCCVILFIIILDVNITHASAWLLEQGRYRYIAGGNKVNKISKNEKKQREEAVLYTTKRIMDLRKYLEEVKNHPSLQAKILRNIKKLEKEILELLSYQDEQFASSYIEYGITDNQNIAIGFLCKENKFLNQKKASLEASIYYKFKLFEDKDFVISAAPKILMADNKSFIGEISVLTGISKNIRSVTIFNQNVSSFGHSINNIGSKKMYYNFSTCEGIKFKNGIMLTSFTKYHIRKNYGRIYDSSVYEQLGAAKIINFGKESRNSLTAQIGYFWDRSLSNKKYRISRYKFFDMVRCIVNSIKFGYKEQRVEPITNRRATKNIVSEFKSIDYINEDKILRIIKDKNLLGKKQSTNLKTIIEEEAIDNEVMIDIFYESKIYPLISNISCIKIYNYSYAQEYVMHGYFIYEDKAGNKITAVNDLKLLFNQKNIIVSIILIKKYHFYKSLEKNFAHLNSIKAKYALEFKVGPIIAKNINYANKVVVFFVVFIVVLIYLPILFHLANNISYCLQNILKSVLFIRAIRDFRSVEIEHNKIDEKELPIYTILVPLYKELSKLRSIIKNISLINYPKNKLDVKIIIEDDDYLMIKELALYNLPAYFYVILVPNSFPKTKPKALNYALEYSRGQYIVVYDAEDKPEPDQLFKALAMFRSLPPEYVCLQAKLNFYNKNENILTKMFNIEYSLWFEYILKGLSLLKLPMPLGGTSNHFKADILHKLGGWDAHNVTEDAELGVRIYSQNYKVAILDSYTLEEAPNSLGNWLNQRSRWIKGFLQTFFVFKAQKDKYKKLSLLQIITVYIFIGLSTYNFWCLPFIIFSIVINKNSIINYLWLTNSIFSLLYLYGTAFYILKSSLKSRKIMFQDLLALVLWVGYFILHTIASYKAVFEIIFCPFKWSKTKHGVSVENFEDE